MGLGAGFCDWMLVSELNCSLDLLNMLDHYCKPCLSLCSQKREMRGYPPCPCENVAGGVAERILLAL